MNLHTRIIENNGQKIKEIISLPYLNPPLDHITGKEIKHVLEWQELGIKNLLSQVITEVVEEAKKEIEKLADKKGFYSGDYIDILQALDNLKK